MRIRPHAHHHFAEGLLVKADAHHEDLALDPDQLAGKREGAAPLAGAGFGSQALDAELTVVIGLRHGRVGLMASGRRDALVLVIDLGRCAEGLLETTGTVERQVCIPMYSYEYTAALLSRLNSDCS